MKESKSDRSSGDLKRNNVYSADAIRDWAWRIRSGAGGLKMNEKFMLVAMATSCNPLGVCELPVRYMADHIGVGLRQAQRIIARLNVLELVSYIDVPPVGRPVDVVRKFSLNIAKDPDTWVPSDAGTKVPLMRRIPRQEFLDTLRQRIGKSIGFDPKDIRNSAEDIERVQMATMFLVPIDIIGVRHKQLDFVSPNATVTAEVYKHQKLFLEVASKLTGSEVRRLHMIPRKGYR